MTACSANSARAARLEVNLTQTSDTIARSPPRCCAPIGRRAGPERFLAEIKTTAKSATPGHLPLHDSGAVDGTVFYVTPFVEGETSATD